MSVKVNITTNAKDLPELLEWVAKLLRSYPNQRFSLFLVLEVQKEANHVCGSRTA
jgi:hypothetical protein